MNDTTNTSSERESKDQVKNDDRLEADDGSRAEKIAAFIAEHQIDVPEGAPAPFLTFAEAPAPEAAHAGSAQAGYESPSSIQAQAWPIALSGKDIVAVAKTGSGKTCGFLLPDAVRVGSRRRARRREMEMVVVPIPLPWEGRHGVVLAPTREARDPDRGRVLEVLPRRGRQGGHAVRRREQRGPAARCAPGADVVVATPGRAQRFLALPLGFSAPVRATHAKYVVLDEADRMLDMGFEPQIRKILKLCPSARQTLMFTATWPEAVKKIAAQFTTRRTCARPAERGSPPTPASRRPWRFWRRRVNWTARSRS